MDKLGIAKDPLRAIGGSLEDGSAILTDLPSLQEHRPTTFEVTVNGHLFSGSYEVAEVYIQALGADGVNIHF